MRVKVIWYHNGQVVCNLPIDEVQRAINICRCYPGTVVITSGQEIIYSHI